MLVLVQDGAYIQIDLDDIARIVEFDTAIRSGLITLKDGTKYQVQTPEARRVATAARKADDKKLGLE